MASLTDNALINKLKQRMSPSVPRGFVAIDFDSEFVRIVHARRTGKITNIETLYSNPVPAELDLNDAEATGKFLALTLKDFSKNTKTSLRRCGVLMSVPRGKAVLKPLTLPPGTLPEEMASMIRFQVEKDLPFTPEESVIDFTITSHLDLAESTNGHDQDAGIGVLVGAVSTEVVDHYRRIAEAAGIKLWRLGLRPYANMKCVDACVRRGEDETVMSVNITSNETEINVLKGNSLAFCRSAVVRVPPGGTDQKRRSVELVVREIVRSIHSYSSAQHHGEITAVLIAGGTGIETQVLGGVEGKLGIQCELLSPAGALDLPTRENASAYSATIGLAIAHQGQDLPFDFLNPKRPPVQHNVMKTRVAIIAAAVVLLLGMVMVARGFYLGGKEETLAGYKSRERKLKKATQGHLQMARRRKTVDAWLNARTNWADHLALISQLAPGCRDLYLRSSFKTERRGTITFKAYAKGHQVLDDFKARLADVGYNPQSKGSGPSDRGDYTHSEEITLTVKPGMPVDLTKHKHVPRPADDDSARQLRNGSSRSGSSGYRRSGGSGRSRYGGSRR
ncbi:MAG: pilus assembly protein PilM [Phycisphaerae bacterium]|jgi:Tfp pilus assembly PilM family ATPase|nr:pilus assembly protein PilM [Phycisphaerae bacterium]